MNYKIIETAIDHKVDQAICVHTSGVYSNFKAAPEEYKIMAHHYNWWFSVQIELDDLFL